MSDSEEEFHSQVCISAAPTAQRHVCLCSRLAYPPQMACHVCKSHNVHACTHNGMLCCAIAHLIVSFCCLSATSHALLRHQISRCVCLLHVCDATGFTVLYISCRLALHLQRPMWLLLAPPSFQHICAASHLPTLAAMCYCLLTLVSSHVTDYCHWVQDFRVSPKP